MSGKDANERHLPSSVSHDVGPFDWFASAAGRLVSQAPFFAFAVLMVVAWLVEGAVRVAMSGPRAFLGQVYQLQINTVTTVVTFLLVALLQNTQARDNEALQEKLNAIADGLSHLMHASPAEEDPQKLHEAMKELRASVGLEEIVGAEDQATD